MIRIPTVGLVGLLTDLVLTAADPDDSEATAGVLLHTVRGHATTGPGRSDLLVGTSTSGVLIGHAWTTCAGQLTTPTLWHVNDVLRTVRAFKSLAKDREHTTKISAGGSEVEIVEDMGTLPGMESGFGVTFASMATKEWPVEVVAGQLAEVRMSRVDSDAVPRMTMTGSRVAPFLKIAARRGEYIEAYRYHHQLPVHLQIGRAYRGVISPVPDDEHPGADAPWGDVHPPVRPAEVDAA